MLLIVVVLVLVIGPEVLVILVRPHLLTCLQIRFSTVDKLNSKNRATPPNKKLFNGHCVLIVGQFIFVGSGPVIFLQVPLLKGGKHFMMCAN